MELKKYMSGSKFMLFLFLICFMNIFNAQSLRIIYKYEFKKDSLNRNRKSETIMNLDIIKNKSYFYENPQLKMGTKQLVNSENGMHSSGVNFSVFKDYSLNTINLHLTIDGQNYQIVEKDKIIWTICEEKKRNQGIQLQKAVTSYLGRNWIAWFSEDYMLPDGPYKFNGLPGLILEIYDDKFDHHFSLVQVNEIKDVNTNYFKKGLKINVETFKKVWRNYKNDPAKSYKNRNKDSGIGYSISMNGISDEKEIIKQIEKSVNRNLKENNNYLDLKLYKND